MPLFHWWVRTGDDCEKRWGWPPAKRLSQVADTVFSVLGHSEVSVTGLPTGIDTSMMQALEMQQAWRHHKTGPIKFADKIAA
ncbi:hypothetical protein E1301_Tti023528 [Triplophysa tibetana]|uniref:Uncharacterized protein n=1 Tax=Triplophysa tibetana TaxID=1572043 RepID=A0A5A9NVG7_9TELE|nr:hypothetical protein E1301_Tti023528 [Triplophysa tibetana]